MTGLDGDVLVDYEQLMSAIRAGIRAHGLTPVTVAGRVGVHPATVTKWLGDRLTPSVEHTAGLADVVGLQLAIVDPSAPAGSSPAARRSRVRAADDVSRLVKRLRARRDVCQRTQESVADVLHVTVGSVSRWERGRRFPELMNLLRWARTLGLVVRAIPGGWPVGEAPAPKRLLVGAGPNPGSTAARRARAGIRY